MHHFRVCKYDPQFRDSSGRYLRNEWTCPSEIGNTFEGREFTREEYLEVEDAYVSAATAFFRSTGLPHLRVCNPVVDMQSVSPGESRVVLPNAADPIRDPLPELVLAEDQIAEPEQIPALIKMNLRPTLSGCTLEFADAFYIDFGWDYYMYVGTSFDPTASLEHAKEQAIFANAMEEPGWRSDPRYAVLSGRRRRLFGLLKNTLIEWESEEFALSPAQVRQVFSLSQEHPGIIKGGKSVRPAHADELAKHVDIRFDFRRNFYELENQS